MIIRIFIFLILLEFGTSCRQQQQTKADLEEYIVNKVWLHFLNENDKSPRQMYFNKSDDKRYIYSATEISGDDTFDLNNIYSPWKKYKGTPETNPHPTVEETMNMRDYEGWQEMDYFKVRDDMILYQDFDDVSGKKLDTFLIKKGQDTVIGIFKYETLKATVTDILTGKPWHQKWVHQLSD